MPFPQGRARLWWAPRLRRLDRRNFLMPAINFTTAPEPPPDFDCHTYCCDAFTPSYGPFYPPGPTGWFFNMSIPPVALLDHSGDGYVAPPRPRPPWKPALAAAGLSPSLASPSSSAQFPPDYEARGARPRASASGERGPPRDDAVSAPDYEDPPPYSVEDQYAPRAFQGMLRGNSRARSASRGNSRGQLGAVADARPRCSSMALEDPPDYDVAVSACPLVSPRALDRPRVAQPQRATRLGAAMSPPALLDAAAAGGLVLEPVMEAEELGLPVLEL